MDSYDLKKERVARLRKLILHSADALAEEVTAYIIRVAAKPRAWVEKEQLLEEFCPVAKHLPAAFVDFALGYLIEAKRTRYLDWSDSGPDKLGIRRVRDYSPAAPVQGPFLHLLREHEQEGLRLVHGLVNAATARWREVEQRGRYGPPPKSPIPLKLNLPDGEQTFWGDDYVYRWYRGTSVGPNAVVSALMALELWIEQQLASKRDATELFRAVLRGAESVAVLGVLVSIALVHPGEALDVLAPLVANARLWHMDIVRLTHDGSGTPVVDFLGRHTEINRILSARNKLPQRRVDIRSLIVPFLFNEKQRDAFLERVRTFGDTLPFQFEEEAGDSSHVEELRERMESFRVLLDPANYRVSSEDGGIVIEFVPPQHLVERDRDATEARDKMAAVFTLKMWARNSLDQGTLADGMTASEAIQGARAIQREDDFATPSSIETHGLDHARLQVIIEVAAAILTANPRPQVSDEDMEWMRTILLGGATTPRAGPVIPTSCYPSDLKVSAALGLGALVGAGQASQEVRRALLSLVGDAEHQVVGAVFRGLRDAWSRDPVLCWNCFSLAISLCCVPRIALVPFSGLRLNESGKQWLTELWETHFEQLQNEEIPDLPAIGDRESVYLQSERMTHLLGPVPVDRFGSEPKEKQRILGLHDSLMARTLEPEDDEDTHEPRHHVSDYTWETNFLRWSARVASMLTPDEEEAHVIQPVLTTWPGRPRLLQQFLDGYLHERLNSLGPLPDGAVAAWERIWNMLLDTPELKSRSRWPDSSSRDDEIDTLAVFVVFGRYFWKETWPHAPRFETLIDQWVRTVGVTQICYHALVTMLKPNVERFAPGTILGWLEHVVDTSQDVRTLWAAYDNGTSTAELLMSLRTKQSESIRREGLTQRLARLVDTLAGAGVATASLLQRELEARE